ncbi:MAG: carboxypeptidase regulatory-like domain-containing protein [Acidobacteriia bacterium]|nr:carboxypeptidase regulatory-like domain-containing protein [Terriglobia bacterium]
MKASLLLILVVSLVAALSVGCSKKTENTEETGANQAAPTPIDQSTVATITGKVSYTGTKPTPKVIHMDTEPACAAANSGPVYTQELEVNSNNTLKDVFVAVTDGANNYTFAVPSTAVTIDQKGCRYHPHVLGLMAGQTLQIENSDHTTHNIHPMPKDNPEWNTSMPQGSQPLEKKFGRSELLIPVKCNVHPWMKAYIGVTKNPFFAVTGDDGSFEIKGLPPGTYTLTAFQEKLGQQTMQVTVGAKETKTADFTFKGE